MTTDMVEYSDAGLRWQSSAILALQEATEAYLVHLFEDTSVFLSPSLSYTRCTDRRASRIATYAPSTPNASR